jgi:hypothetical protein
MKRQTYFHIPLSSGRVAKRGKLVMGRPGPWRIREVIGTAMVNPRGCAQGSKTVIVGM